MPTVYVHDNSGKRFKSLVNARAYAIQYERKTRYVGGVAREYISVLVPMSNGVGVKPKTLGYVRIDRDLEKYVWYPNKVGMRAINSKGESIGKIKKSEYGKYGLY